jgi:methionine sulfoxide reductase heme-binding subunit
MLLPVFTDPTPYLFWITSRAAGFAALILASVAVSFGLLMSTKLLRGRGADLKHVHEVLALSTIVAIVVHGVSLLGDSYFHPSVADISIPFASSYRTGWTSLGIVAGWALVLLGLSYYARKRLGAKRWRSLHRFTALAWLAGLAHALGEGTDAGQLWFIAMLAIVAAPAVLLLGARLAGYRRAPRPSTPRPAAPRQPARELFDTA